MTRDTCYVSLMLLLSTQLLVSCAGAPELTTHRRPNAFISRPSTLAVVPSKMGRDDDFVLPDALATELLGLDINVIERTALAQILSEKGFDLTEILSGQEYFKIGKVTNVRIIVIVNSTMQGVGVANATMRVVDMKTGSIILSTNYTQPVPENSTYINHHNVIRTARALAETIRPIVR